MDPFIAICRGFLVQSNDNGRSWLRVCVCKSWKASASACHEDKSGTDSLQSGVSYASFSAREIIRGLALDSISSPSTREQLENNRPLYNIITSWLHKVDTDFSR